MLLNIILLFCLVLSFFNHLSRRTYTGFKLFPYLMNGCTCKFTHVRIYSWLWWIFKFKTKW
jgi:hypothetical protein